MTAMSARVLGYKFVILKERGRENYVSYSGAFFVRREADHDGVVVNIFCRLRLLPQYEEFLSHS